MFFYNGWRDENKAQGISETISDILFSGTDALVHDSIYQQLVHLSVPNLEFHPSIYIDDTGQWHEDYWYLTFTERFDCWDRDLSEFPKDIAVSLGGDPFMKYFLFALIMIYLR